MSRKIFWAAFVAFAALTVSAEGFKDPDFELSPAGQLKKWSGGPWILLTQKDIKAEIIADASRAYSGKQYLFISNPDKLAIMVGGFPRIDKQPGKRYILTCHARGTAKLSIRFLRDDSKMKSRPWDPKSAHPAVRLTPDKWTEQTWSYVPQEDDAKLYIGLAVSEGDAEIDGMSLKVEDIAK